MKTEILPADMKDFKECVQIAERAWEKGYAEYMEILGIELFNIIFPDWKKAKADSMEPFFNGDRELLAYKVLSDGLLAGFITARIDYIRKVGVICNNAVDPDFQGRGIGSMMYDSILDKFRSLGMMAAEVSTMNEDAYLAARKAYEKVGFDRKLEKMTYYMKL
jgi:ribosomal protein S18 acetylase RimI-like enzyme